MVSSYTVVAVKGIIGCLPSVHSRSQRRSCARTSRFFFLLVGCNGAGLVIVHDGRKL